MVELPQDFGYVIGVIGLQQAMNMFLMINVVKARKEYNVQYPALYAPESHKNAKEFNCVQRAHQNTLESWAPVQIMMIINGFFNPVLSASFGLVWTIGRIFYGLGYKQSPSGRMFGGILSHLGDWPLIVYTFINAGKLLKWF